MYGEVVGLAAGVVVLTVFVVVSRGHLTSAVAGQHMHRHWSKHPMLSPALQV